VAARFAGSGTYNPRQATAALTVPGYSITGSTMQVGGPVAGATVTASSPRPTDSVYTSWPGTAIPDNSAAGIEAPIVVSDTGVVTGLKVGVDITHTWIGDLGVILRHPDGTEVILHNHTGGSLYDIVTSYPDLTTPAQSLGVLLGKPMAGTWKLIVKDSAAGDIGILNAWALSITHDVLQPAASAVSSSAGAYQISGLNAGTYTLTAAKPGYTLAPSSLVITVGPNATGANFSSSLVSTSLAMPDKSGFVGGSVQLSATLTQTTPGTALAGKTIAFTVDGASAGTAVTDAAGVATLAYAIPADAVAGARPMSASFAGDGTLAPADATATLTAAKAASALYLPDRSGVITTTIALKAYLRRISDSAKLAGRTVDFAVAGTSVGSAVTSVDGEAALLWTITAGAATRTLGGSFAGDAMFLPCAGSATLTSTTVATKVYVVDRTNVKIKTYTVLKAYLYTTANVILPGKTLTMTVDGTSLGSQATNSSGYISYGYTVPEGTGAGNRVVGASWAGNAGYPASSNTGKLGVVQGNLYLWPYVRSGKRGTVHPLKAYVRSLPDYVIQPGKPITFKVNGSTIGSANVAADGWATVNWTIPAGEATGSHTCAAEFAGDAWYVAVTANTAFNVVP
jgi:subtilisin-like proprotein convertase family protein